MTPDCRSILMAMTPAKPRVTARAAKPRASARPKAAVAASARAGGKPDAGQSVISAELAESMLSAMYEGVIVFAPDGKPIYCNQRSAEITGITIADRLATPLEEVVRTMV